MNVAFNNIPPNTMFEIKAVQGIDSPGACPEEATVELADPNRKHDYYKIELCDENVHLTNIIFYQLSKTVTMKVELPKQYLQNLTIKGK